MIAEIESFIHENLPQWECGRLLVDTLIPESKMFIHENLPQWECIVFIDSV